MIDIIELAKKAGYDDATLSYHENQRIIERFAALYKQALIDSGELVEAEKVKVNAMICEKCGADRYQESCKGRNLLECPFMGLAARSEK